MSHSLLPALLAGLLLSACGADSDECAAGQNRICMGVDNCLCGDRCADDSDCKALQTCAENISDERACVARVFADGRAPECISGQRATVALCGSDSCSCADACGVAEDCRSLCCVDGYCAMPCACGMTAGEVIECGGT